jgi:hypothetical protein
MRFSAGLSPEKNALALLVVLPRRLVQDEEEMVLLDRGALATVGVLAKSGRDGVGKDPVRRRYQTEAVGAVWRHGGERPTKTR